MMMSRVPSVNLTVPASLIITYGRVRNRITRVAYPFVSVSGQYLK